LPAMNSASLARERHASKETVGSQAAISGNACAILLGTSGRTNSGEGVRPEGASIGLFDGIFEKPR
jgi:hypothetical protein